jgi:hypothetical protein
LEMCEWNGMFSSSIVNSFHRVYEHADLEPYKY